MISKFRILTFHHIPNNGAFLFAYALMKWFQSEFPRSEVKVVDYKSTRLALYESLKRFKLFPGVPLYYYKRSKMWNSLLTKHLDLDKDFPKFSNPKKLLQHLSRHSNLLITGMDVWCVKKGTERPIFPNIYWLPEEIEVPKMAYAVSGYNSDLDLFQARQKAITTYLNGFDVIGARDRFTHEMVRKYRTRGDGLIERIPDPTFLYDHQQTGVKEKLSSLGVDFDRPILGLLLYGEPALSKDIKEYFSSRGYQILALSMYNPVADLNLGHILDPFEWAEVFRYLTFCITDRFHGTIFCLKSGIPFISLEKDYHLPLSQSKIFDLLTDFDLTECYANAMDKEFDPQKFLSRGMEIEISWEKYYKPQINHRIQKIKNSHQAFIHKARMVLNWQSDGFENKTN